MAVSRFLDWLYRWANGDAVRNRVDAKRLTRTNNAPRREDGDQP